MIKKALKIRLNHESLIKIILFPLISLIIPWIFIIIWIDINKVNNIEAISIISWFIASALAIIVTNTKMTEDAKKSIYNNPEYEKSIKSWNTPEKIFKNQKLFLIRSILIQVILVLITIILYQISMWINIDDTNWSIVSYIKITLDYLCLTFFILSSISIINITYYSIKHVLDFDINPSS